MSEGKALRVNSFPIGRIRLETGDMTRLAADAIVNAANSLLLGGGGAMGRPTARQVRASSPNAGRSVIGR